MIPKFFGAFLSLVVLLSACSTMSVSTSPSTTPAPAAGMTAFALDARFSATLEKDAGAPKKLFGRLSWRHEGDSDELLFSDPLGRGVARLLLQNDRLTLERSGKKEVIENSPQELEERIGFPLPLAELPLWAQARTGPGAIVERDAQGRVRRARESGWLLTYRYPNEAEHLPNQLEASFEQFRLKLVIERWETP